MNKEKLEILFFRRLTGEEVQEVPPHAVDLLASISESIIKRSLVSADLKTYTIRRVAIRYGMKYGAVRSIGRQTNVVK